MSRRTSGGSSVASWSSCASSRGNRPRTGHWTPAVGDSLPWASRRAASSLPHWQLEHPSSRRSTRLWRRHADFWRHGPGAFVRGEETQGGWPSALGWRTSDRPANRTRETPGTLSPSFPTSNLPNRESSSGSLNGILRHFSVEPVILQPLSPAELRGHDLTQGAERACSSPMPGCIAAPLPRAGVVKGHQSVPNLRRSQWVTSFPTPLAQAPDGVLR